MSVRIQVVTHDPEGAWLAVIDGRDRHVEVGVEPVACDAFDLIVHDRDDLLDVAVPCSAEVPLIVVASRFAAGEENALLRAGAAACVLKSDFDRLDALCEREVNRITRSAPRICPYMSMESAMRDSEERFRILSQAAFDGILVHEDGQVTWVNEQCAAMFGYDAASMLGLSIFDLTASEMRAALKKHVSEGSNQRFESVAVRADGVTFPVEVCGVSKEGTKTRVVALRDLTDRRSAEALLIESERRYRELSESTHTLLCQHDLDGNIVAVNNSVAYALGIPAEELRTMNLRDVVAPEARRFCSEYFAAIARDGVAEGIMAVQTRSGETRMWHYQNALMSSRLGRPIVRGMARDVTDRAEAIRALRASEEHFRSLIENTTDLIAIVDRDGRLDYHSPSAERLLGYSSVELHRCELASLIHPDDIVAASPLFAIDPVAPKSVETPDVRLRHRDGSWRWFSFVAQRITSAHAVKSIIVNGRDVTDRRLLVSQLDQAQRLTSLGRLAATVAHEFNNVLMGMQPFAELLQRSTVSAEMVAKGARHIANSIARGKHVALDILRFTQPAEPSIKPFDLREWWDRFSPECVATTRSNITFVADVPKSLTILGDTSQLSQLFGNLINNARDAMPSGGRLRIEARVPRADETFPFGVVASPHEFVQISVTDSGHGMPPHVRDHAFDPLFTTKQNGGTGLGLAVAHQIVTRHGGSIFVESEVDAGTTFHVFLPLANAHPVEEIEPEAAQVRARRVLMVEDERDIAAGLGDLLALHDLESAHVPNGLSAEAMAESFQPDVALVDIGLPDIDGFEVGRRLRAADSDLKIVFISGHGDARQVPSVDPNMAFLQKPFAIETVLATIAELEGRGAS